MTRSILRSRKMRLKQNFYYALGGVLVIFIFFMWSNSNFRYEIYSFHYDSTVNQNGAHSTKYHTVKNSNLKYILIWTSPKSEPISFLGEGQGVFKRKKCSVPHCYVTADKNLFNNITMYDAVLFHAPEIHRKSLSMPGLRSPNQLYVFVSMESADYYPLCSNRYNNQFNLTWTYKLNSDIYFGYMVIRNKTGDLIGPNQIMHWMKLEDMDPINDEIKEKLKHKSIAAAWFVSNCKAPSGRDNFVRQVQNELSKYKLAVDVYGKCGDKECPRGVMANCLDKIETDYYFYFSFENSFSDDYVTEKLLHALNNYAIPVVYGTDNYTRFMPDGIYLNALKLGPKELAKQMAEIIKDKDRYYNFFKWHNHYSYYDIEEAGIDDPTCKMCEKVNNKAVIKSSQSYDDLQDWWNPKKLRTSVCGFSFW